VFYVGQTILMADEIGQLYRSSDIHFAVLMYPCIKR